MNQIFYSDEMKRFEQEEPFRKRIPTFLLKKAGAEIYKFINNNFKKKRPITAILCWTRIAKLRRGMAIVKSQTI